MQKLALTIEEAIEAGAGSRTKVYEALKAGTLKARKRGGRTVILTSDLQKYLDDLPDYEPQTAA